MTPPPYKVFWNWDIHYSCNYRCSYCFFSEDWKWIYQKNRYPGLSKWLEIWERIYAIYGSCHIHFSGGEPFTYPSFLSLTSKLSIEHTLELSTNLSFDISYFVKIIKPDRANIDASFHPEFVNANIFLEKILFLRNNNFPITVTTVGYPPFLDTIDKAKAMFEEAGIKFIIQPFRGKFQNNIYPDAYSEREKIFFEVNKNNGNRDQKKITSHHLYKEKKPGRLCSMGQFYGKIYPNGDVYRCCAQKELEPFGPLGNLIDQEEFRLFEEPKICEIENCPCWKAMIIGEEDKWLPHW